MSADGTIVRCMRTPNNRPSTSVNGEVGYIHRLTDAPPAKCHRRSSPVPDITPPPIDFEPLMRDYQLRTSPVEVRRLAGDLGVTPDSLFRLGIVWCGPYRAWGFPMKDERGLAVGIRLRSETGDKWSVSASRSGLFIPSGRPAEGDPILLPEGPTDTAALLSLGFFAIGRPSCSGGAGLLAPLLGGLHVVVVGDRDEAKPRADGSVFYPGQDGAERLADALLLARAKSVKVVYPIKGKDIRQWVRHGATAQDIRTLIRQCDRWTLKEQP
jgi:hypothetical protein